MIKNKLSPDLSDAFPDSSDASSAQLTPNSDTKTLERALSSAEGIMDYCDIKPAEKTNVPHL